MDYTVIYRTGGELMCEWHRVSARFTKAGAQDKVKELERMGYRAIANKWKDDKIIGLPVGWDHTSIDWERDTISISLDKTSWKSHTL